MKYPTAAVVTWSSSFASVSSVVHDRPRTPRRLPSHDETLSIAMLKPKCHGGDFLVLRWALYGRRDRQAVRYGVATLDHDVPATPQTVFSIASVDKQFTALSVMLLVETTKCRSTNLSVATLPRCPASWADVHVRHLLTHTSGLGDAAQDAADAPAVYTRYTTRDLLERILRTHPDSPPGTRWRYSGDGFLLLQLLVERVSGVEHQQFLTTRVLQPLE